MAQMKTVFFALAAILVINAAGTSSSDRQTGAMGTPQGAIYYVAPTGNDDHIGDLAHPWRTIQKAADYIECR